MLSSRYISAHEYTAIIAIKYNFEAIPWVGHLHFFHGHTVGILYAPAAPRWDICHLSNALQIPGGAWASLELTQP